MGACESKQNLEGDDTYSPTHKLDTMIMADRLQQLYRYKVLVLGAGESGKSTVIKQIQMSNREKPFYLTDLDRASLRQTLIQNLSDCLLSVVNAAERLDVSFEEKEQIIVQKCVESGIRDGALTPELAADIEILVASKTFQDVFRNYRGRYWILDNAEFYFENARRFANDSEELDDSDFVMARIRTTGIVQCGFESQNPASIDDIDSFIHWDLIDVGGQRNERRKWMHCFDDVHAIVFVVNLAGYNRPLFEDEGISRLREALSLFEETVHKRVFQKTPIFLLLNKKDLFEASVRKEPISVCFEEFSGGHDVLQSMKFIGDQFRSLMPANAVPLSIFEVAARVRREVKCAFDDIASAIIHHNRSRIESEARRLREELRLPTVRTRRNARTVNRVPSKVLSSPGTVGHAGYFRRSKLQQ